MDNQQKITREVNATNILITLKQLGSGMIYTAHMFSDLLDIDAKEIKDALKFLKRKKYITVTDGEYFLTDDGEKCLKAAKSRPHMDTGDAYNEWKDEVLSGMKEIKSKVTGQMITTMSEIDKAVLSTAKGRVEIRNPESIYIAREETLERRMELAEYLGISLTQLTLYLDDYKIHECGDHVGIIDRGETICRACKEKLK